MFMLLHKLQKIYNVFISISTGSSEDITEMTTLENVPSSDESDGLEELQKSQ